MLKLSKNLDMSGLKKRKKLVKLLVLLSIVCFTYNTSEVLAKQTTGEPPTDLLAVSAPLSIDLTWQAPDSALSYNIYRDDIGFITYVEGSENTFYIDYMVAVGNEYTYYVTAVYEEGESGPSNTDSAIPFLPSGVGWVEDFTVDYHDTGWTEDPINSNWRWADWSPIGYADFFWYPQITNYDQALISPEIDLPDTVAGLTITMFAHDYSIDTGEVFEIIIIHNGLEDTLWHWDMDIHDDWGDQYVGTDTTWTDMDAYEGQTVQLKFRAYGENSYNIFGWKIFNICFNYAEYGTLTGTVTDTLYNQLEDVSVSTSISMGDCDIDYRVYTNEYGSYTISPMIAGTYDIVEFAHSDYNNEYQSVEIIEDETAALNVIMYPRSSNPPRDLIASDDLMNGILISWSLPEFSGSSEELTEGFENNCLSIPFGWEQIINNYEISSAGGYACTWAINYVPVFVFEGSYSCGIWWDTTHQNEWLITPEFACGSDTELGFWSYGYEGSTYDDHYYVRVSTNGGATWTDNNIVFDLAELTGNGWNEYAYPYNIDLSAYAGEDIMLAWNAVGEPGSTNNNGLWYVWFIDNIAITTGGKVIAFDVGDITYRNNDPNSVKQIAINNINVDKIQISRDGTYVKANKGAQKGACRDVTLNGYNLYRSDTENGTYTLIADEIDSTSYFDTNIVAGEDYWYYAKAIYDVNNEIVLSPHSNKDSGMMQPSGTIEGTVCLVGSLCAVTEVEITAVGPITSTVNPDDSGYYVIQLVPGTYDVTAYLEDYLPQTLFSIEVIENQANLGNDFILEIDNYIEYEYVYDDTIPYWGWCAQEPAGPSDYFYKRITLDTPPDNTVNFAKTIRVHWWGDHQPYNTYVESDVDIYLCPSVDNKPDLSNPYFVGTYHLTPEDLFGDWIDYYLGFIPIPISGDVFIVVGWTPGTPRGPWVAASYDPDYIGDRDAYTTDGITWTPFAGNKLLIRLVVEYGNGVGTDPENLFIPVTKLNPNFPNPFNNLTTISFSLKDRSHVKISVYNIKGQLVAKLFDDEINPGKDYKIVWDGKSDNKKLANGIYFYKLETSGNIFIRKMIIIK